MKFRIWDNQTEQMYFVKMIDLMTGEIMASKTHGIEDLIRLVYDSSDFTILMQFIESFDKNGKDIYDGDIVVWKNLNDKAHYEIYYNLDDLQWFARPLNNLDETESYLDYTQMEIVGNIHENQNLIT